MAKKNLDYIFNPRSVAIAGVSSKHTSSLNHGQRYLQTLLGYGFEGQLYPLNPNGGEIMGLKIYPNVKDVPGPVDYVISCIPAPATPQLIKDCAAKGVKAVQFYSSGFAELDTVEGKQLEREISLLARQGGVRVIGPNCAGVYCPKTGLSSRTDFARESGPVALICQSGGNFTYLVREGNRRGLRFSKVVSYGNASDINESELLEYLAADSDTGIILAYIEGVKDGKSFVQALREAARVKSVVVLKGGVSESGAKVAASHTGSLAGSGRIWDDLLRQTGAIKVYNLDELIDVAVAFSYLTFPLGRKVGVLGIGGAVSVLAADYCTGAGLVVPGFSGEIRRKLSHLFKAEAGTILNNPLDIASEAWGVGFYPMLKILDEYDDVDLTMVHFPLGMTVYTPPGNDKVWDSLLKDVVKAHRESAKPLIVVIHMTTSFEDYEWMLGAQKVCYEAGIPVFHSIASAAEAVDRFLGYHERKCVGDQG